MQTMSHTDDLLANNDVHAKDFDPGPLPNGAKVAIVCCMDARIDVWRILGLQDADAHVIRNAGGVVTDDEIRSIAISQRLLGSTEVMVINHTRCGMLSFTDDDFREELRRETVSRPEWDAGAFTDLDQNVRDGVARIKESRFIPHTDKVRGFVYELESGRLREVT
jgi:carbonic anhydrase